MTCKDCKYYETEMETGYGDYCDLHKFRFEGDIHTCEHFEPKPTFFSRTPKSSAYTGSGGNAVSPTPSGTGSRSSRKGCLVVVVILLIVAVVLALMLLGTVRPVQTLDGTQDLLPNSNTLLKSFPPLTFPMELV